MTKEILHENITSQIIKAFYSVYYELGYGFLEKVYENAMSIEIKRLGLKCENQHPIIVKYQGIEIGNYFADLIVENCVIVELKAIESLTQVHEVQLVNYLKATGTEVGLLLNFGPRPKFMRRVFSKEYQNKLANIADKRVF
ncbi:hypothetical protein SDC9_46756 [bioreactor metagenome]|uniref:GxxExxY protein n=1 Tax=bioreactor metagenome TaxID=1076179 RepID=A0A644W9R4_9ZZZZ